MNDAWKKIWSWVEKNRWTVIAPILGIVIWLVAVGCSPVVTSPVTGDEVTPAELEDHYEVYIMEHEIVLKKFEAAAEDIERQKEDMEKLKEVILALASGSVADWGGLIQLVVSGGALGVILDNARKNGVIGGLKRALKEKDNA